MATAIGAKSVLKIGDSANTLQDVSAYVKNDELQRKIADLESTTMGATAKTFKPGLLDSTIQFDGFFDPALDAILNGIVAVADRNWEYYPQGLGTGNVKYSGVGFLTSYDMKTQVDQLGDAIAQFRVSGAVTRAVL